MRFSKMMVITCFISLHVFTLIALIFVWNKKYIPDILYERFFTVIGVEFGVVALVSIVKVIMNKKGGE